MFCIDSVIVVQHFLYFGFHCLAFFLDAEWGTLLNFIEQSIKLCSDVLVSSSNSAVSNAGSVPNHTHGMCDFLVFN